MFGVTILGNNSALPAYDRHPTSQVVTIHDQLDRKSTRLNSSH